MINRIAKVGQSIDIGLHAIRMFSIVLQAGVFFFLAYALRIEEFGRFSIAWVVAQGTREFIAVGGPSYILENIFRQMAQPSGRVPVYHVLIFGLPIPVMMLILLACIWYMGPFEELIQRSTAWMPTRLLICGIAAFAVAQNLVWVAASMVRAVYGTMPSMLLRDVVPFLALLVCALLLHMVGRLSPSGLLVSSGILLLLAGGLVTVITIFRGRQRLTFARQSLEPIVFAHWGSAIVGALAAQFDIVLGALFLSADDLGVYALLKRMASMVITTQAVENWKIAAAVAAAHARAETDGLRRAVLMGHRATMVPALLLSIAVLGTTPVWYGIFDLNDLWQTGEILVIMLANSLAALSVGPVLIVASQCGLESVALRARLIAITIGVAAGIAGCWSLGTAGLALAHGVSLIAMRLLIWAGIRQRLRVDTAMFARRRAYHP